MEKQIYFQIKHGFDRSETERYAKKALADLLVSKKSLTIKRLAPAGFTGLLLSGMIINAGLFPSVTPAVMFLVCAAAVYVITGLALYCAVMAGVKKELDKTEKEGREREKDLCQDFTADGLIISSPQHEEISYDKFKTIKEEEEAFILVMKNGREIHVRKADFVKGMPEQFPDFIRRSMSREKIKSSPEELSGEKYQFSVKTVNSERICVNRTAAERRYKKRKWSKGEKYGVPVVTVILLTGLVLGSTGFSQDSLQILLNALPVAVVLEIVVLYFAYIHNVKKEEKAIVKAGKRSWQEIKRALEKEETSPRPLEVVMHFGSGGFWVDDGISRLLLDYDRIRGLYETEECFYLDDLRILGKETLDKKGVEGGKVKELKEFLEDRCGMEFKQVDLPSKI